MLITKLELEIDFENGYKDFVINVRNLGFEKLGMDNEGRANLIDFIKRFR